MSRVILLSLSEGEVIAKCLDAKVGVSAIERLPAGGVRLVCMSGAGAALLRTKLKKSLLDSHAARERHRPVSPLW
ncbi:MAG: hypothetical protein QOK41_229 [Sphingomonadales bacterium]|jgi:hypothetical protein|nr:hypothetical protein [Sphingomonadales bacterium]